jgi:SAM-dependent methyltransferase
LIHSLEHIQNPTRVIKKIYRILKPGGIVIVAVPNFDSFMCKFFGKYWFHWDIPRHIFHYNEKVLKGIFLKNKFLYLKTKYMYSGYACSLSIQNIINAVLKKKILLRDSNLPNNGLIRLMSFLIFGILPVIFKSGDVVEITFTKPK